MILCPKCKSNHVSTLMYVTTYSEVWVNDKYAEPLSEPDIDTNDIEELNCDDCGHSWEA